MANEYIPYLSVDSVLFGFDQKQLKVLLIKREKAEGENPDLHSGLSKLPGRLIYENEFLEEAAAQLIRELTMDDNIHMQQFQVFDNPTRIQSPNDLFWLETMTGLKIRRVVTVAFYALVEITEELTEMLEQHNARWVDIAEAKELAFDHDEIVREAYAYLKKELTTAPLEFNLLPEYFTLNSLQTLYEVILGQRFDNRNFRKKILKMPYLIETDERECNVTHRPAKLYRFDAQKYAPNKREMSLFFL